MEPTHWNCDTCGEMIDRPHDGWVEWFCKVENGIRSGSGFRLVHKSAASPRGGARNCQYDGRAVQLEGGMALKDDDMTEFMGADGLTRLLCMLSDNELPKDEVIEMIKRLHVPGYETARDYFEQAISGSAFSPRLKPGFHTQSEIMATIAWAEERGDVR